MGLGDIHHGGRGQGNGRRAQPRPRSPVHVAKRCPAKWAPPNGASPDPSLGEGCPLVSCPRFVRGLSVSPVLLSGLGALGDCGGVQFCVPVSVSRASLQLSFIGDGPAGEGGALSGSVQGPTGTGAGYGREGCSWVQAQAWMG